MLKRPISITALSSISALGSDSIAVLNAYQSPHHRLTQKDFEGKKVWVGAIANEEIKGIERLMQSNAKYRNLDKAVLYGLYVSQKAVEEAGWNEDASFGINMGSSRGATSLFERYHKEFIEKGKTAALTSPTTTLGNISSWIAHDLQTRGPVISHSITCSTALHAILNGVAWLQSGLSDKFLVGGSEAPLTSFTIAQIQALKLYTKATRDDMYPCRAMDMGKTGNTMVLGEGAAVACLEVGNTKNRLATIQGIGYATEELHHNVSISSEAKCFQDSMRQAIGSLATDDIDAVVMHAPGTIKGDSSELKAIEKVFCNKIPFLTTNKWKVGHTFGASGMLSIEMATLMLTHQKPLPVPFVNYQETPKAIEKVLVNAVGFGGNAVSILLSK